MYQRSLPTGEAKKARKMEAFKFLECWMFDVFYIWSLARFMFQEYLRAPSANLRCFILISLFSFSKYLHWGLDPFWWWHFVGLGFLWFQSHPPLPPISPPPPSPCPLSSCRPSSKGLNFFAFRISQDLECHTRVISVYFTSDEVEGVHAPLTELNEAI